MTAKQKDILKALGFLLVIGIFVWSVSNIIETKNRQTVEKIISDSEKKEQNAKREREKIAYNNFILARRFDSLQSDMNSHNNLLIGIKKDYGMHIEQFNQIKENEKKFIPNATLSEQLDVISTVKYSEFK